MVLAFAIVLLSSCPVLAQLAVVADNVSGLLPELMRDSGFVEVREAERYMTLFGTLSSTCAVER